MQAKLNPFNDAKISFPGFQRILDFTATGSESTKSVAVDGDTDKEYKILIWNSDASHAVRAKLNNSSGADYGYQYLYNNAGTITAGRSTAYYICEVPTLGFEQATILTPAGFIKTSTNERIGYTSGTTITFRTLWGYSYNSTANITSIDFLMSDAGAFTAGTRITVFARRSQ